ncbi:hypothetical protein BABINDRAFT_160934 [Babjeviella inositovora NRRL Y-12698]|uniref:Gamma-glutamyltransferase n=1 Tax=Babjeviella inositovora NRRL Y-12698 TaxID=984486 RepID=A0A1E3QSN5_9ASCO|nr:uncharacterized protein BABINDRAFT_160934 [Babjeviella inositovora NRRL Y-12698]ODQ80701.1 hypothetical protein BABINDRAFT_160934 [Babjeviella inositovora NRRL Y-12698]
MSHLFYSTRSTVYSTKGIVSSTQPLANAAGLKILEKGGNCVDACVAISAALCVTEPPSTGIGGDCFALYYNARSKTVEGINGTGRAAKKVTVDMVRKSGIEGPRMPATSIYTVNVPGAIAGWVDSIEKWGSGKVSLAEILQPAIDLAETGFPVSKTAASIWQNCVPKILKSNPDERQGFPLLVNGLAPKEGEFVQNKLLAQTFRDVAEQGKDGFYKGRNADLIIKEVQKRGGVMELLDLSSHTSTFVQPIKQEIFGKNIWEIPPNGQGLVALLALGLVKALEKSGRVNLFELKHNSPEYIHLLIEALKISFYDSDEYVTDPEFYDLPLEALLSPKYLDERAKLFSADRLIDLSNFTHGIPDPMFKSDTVYFTVSDSNGDACSFINSVYEGFGSAIIPEGTGYALHNRGANFNLTAGSKNCLEGGKRPYHTIIPAMITDASSNELYASFGNMGGYMQATGHVQHVLNMLLFGFNPQESVDSPRICLCAHPDQTSLDRGKGPDGPVSTPVTLVAVEEGMPQETIDGLKALGHEVKVYPYNNRGLFGRAQIIRNESKNGQLIYAGGSDNRGDGAAVPFV